MTTTAEVYRPNEVQYDRFGDRVVNGQVIRPEAASDYLGTLEIVLSTVNSEPVLPRLTSSAGANVDRGEAADINLLIGAPRDGAIKLRHGDRVIITDTDGFSLVVQVVGPRLFDAPNSLSGFDHKWYWISGIATDG